MKQETDLKLLKNAAKAAGISYTKPNDDYDGSLGLAIGDNPMRTRAWNPLRDDGDALRLAVKLSIDVWYSDDLCIVGTTFMCGNDGYNTEENWVELDKMIATRRAIVRAAAEIGKTK